MTNEQWTPNPRDDFTIIDAAGDVVAFVGTVDDPERRGIMRSIIADAPAAVAVLAELVDDYDHARAQAAVHRNHVSQSEPPAITKARAIVARHA